MLVLLTILLLAVALRVRFLFQTIRFDESYTFLVYASRPLAQGLSEYYLPNNHLFYTFLIHITYSILGSAPWVLRLPAFLAGILLVPASYVMVRTFYDKHAALLTAGILASSSALILYSTMARGYTLLILIFLLLFVLADRLKRNPTIIGWALFTVLTVMGFYTIPIMLYAHGVLGVWFVLSILVETAGTQRLRLLLYLTLSSIVGALVTYLLYLPVIRFSGLAAITIGLTQKKRS